MKKIISLALALALCLGLCVPVLAVEFSDVPPSHTFYSAVMDCAGKGIVGGYSDGTFQPGKTVTRSNFAVMLSRAFYADEVAANQIPLYTEKGTFYPNYMALYLNGIFSGTDLASKNALQNAAVMDTGINRYEMAQMMTNIMTRRMGFSASDSEKSVVISEIADYASIPSQYQDAVLNVYALGIIGGYGNGTFSGESIMNRGQACVVIYRMTQYSGNSGARSGITGPSPDDTMSGSTTAGTLSDGSEATEENVMRLLEEAYQAKAGKTFGTVGAGDGYPAGINSTLYQTITKGPYKSAGGSLGLVGVDVSVQGGCGGFSAYLSDYVFGQKAAVRETTLDKMRAGDVILHLIDNQITHVNIYDGTTGTGTDIYGKPATEYGTYDANAGTNPDHTPNTSWHPNDGINTDYKDRTISYVIYTRYPD